MCFRSELFDKARTRHVFAFHIRKYEFQMLCHQQWLAEFYSLMPKQEMYFISVRKYCKLKGECDRKHPRCRISSSHSTGPYFCCALKQEIFHPAVAYRKIIKKIRHLPRSTQRSINFSYFPQKPLASPQST